MTMDVKRIFGNALEILKEEERAAYLEKSCEGNQALRAEVEELLGAIADAGEFLVVPRDSSQATLEYSEIKECPGTVIGRYKLLEQIGEGGMGVVFMAEQTEPVRRKVAMKVIKPGMDTKQVIARFRAERQALAIMDHPNIAHVYDAGATESGRPYFVMELVRGIPITEYSDQKKLTTRERLELFRQACQAIQHAHQKGVIHRDIKPSNVLVSPYDGVPVVKIIDFGIAKAASGHLTDKTLFTGFAQMLGTPLYMSPEQAEVNALDVDTRSDIYSLGVMLYELLTRVTPFDKELLKKADHDEMRRIIREDEPPKPSNRISTLQAMDLSTVSDQRGADPRRLIKQLRGELDWIVMKTLEKDRKRRYETVSALEDDVQRYLNDEPVVACPPSATYRLAKFTRRHRVFLTVTTVITVILLIGTLVSALLAVRAVDAEDLAAGRLREVSQQRDIVQRALGATQKQTALAILRLEALQRSKYNLQLLRVGEIWRTRPLVARQILEDPKLCPPQLRDFTWELYHGLTRDRIRIRNKWLLHGSIHDHLFSADGKTAATITSRGRGPQLHQLRSSETGQVKATLKNPSKAQAQAFSPDGALLAVGYRDSMLKLWTVDGKMLKTIAGHQAGVNAVSFSPNGKILASAGGREILLWNTETWQPLSVRLDESASTIHFLGFSPDSNTLVAAIDQTIKLWDVSTCRSRATLTGHRRPISGLAISSDGKTLASTDGIVTKLWDAATGRERATLTGHTLVVNALTFAPDGTTLATGSDDTIVRLWSTSTGKHLADLTGHVAAITTLAYSRDGRTLASGSKYPDLSIKLWSTKTLQVRATLIDRSFYSIVTQLNFSADGHTLFSRGHANGRVNVAWDVGNQARGDAEVPLESKTHPGGGVFRDGGRAISPDGTILAESLGSSIVLRSTETLRELARFETPNGANSLSFSPDGKTLATATTHDRNLWLWDLQLRKVRKTLPLRCRSQVFGFSRDGRRLAVSALAVVPGRHSVEIWDVELGQPIATWADCNRPVLAPDGATIAVRLIGKGVCLCDVNSGKQLKKLNSAKLPLAFSPDGKTFLSSGPNNTGQLWEVRTGSLIATLVGHATHVSTAAFSKDGKVVATASATEDRTIRLWDPVTGEARAVLKGTQSIMSALAFGPDNQSLVAAAGNTGDITLFSSRDRASLRAPTHVERERSEAFLRYAISCVGSGNHEEGLNAIKVAIEHTPRTSESHYQLALVALVANYRKGYRDVCVKMLDRFRTSSNTEDLYYSVWACVLTPDAVDDYLLATDLAQKAVHDDPKPVFPRQALGAVLYRAQDYKNARKVLEELAELEETMPEETMFSTSPAYHWYFLAMTYDKLDMEPEAKKWLNKADKWTKKVLDKNAQKTAPVSWNRRLTLELLQREAKDVLNNPKKALKPDGS